MKTTILITTILIIAGSSSLYAEGVTITPYGYLKLDASLDSSEISAGNFARWVSGTENDAQFNMTARQTRLGVNFAGPEGDDVKTDGKVEIDFYNDGGAENKNHVMLRHAFFKAVCPVTGIEVIAGQTSDVISPLVPDTINYSVAWWCGDIGYRRPQVRLTKALDIAENTSVKFAVAATRTIGTEPGTGEDSGVPTVQGRVGITVGPATLGVSGHYGEEEYNEISKTVETTSFNADLVITLCKYASLKAEYFTGSDLDAYLGGIGQGVDKDVAEDDGSTTSVKGIDATGGWVALTMGPFGKCNLNIGAAMDDPDNADLNQGARAKNSSVWGNVKYSVTEALSVGFEVSQWETDYIGETSGRDATRYQGTMIYAF